VSASPHQFHPPAGPGFSDGGGVASDRGSDPWGVRRAENLLTSLEGVLSARVVTTPLGEVSEVHVLATNAQTPKQVVRNVESALLAHLGLRIDHRKISVAHTAEVQPIKALEETAVRARSNQRTLLFEDVTVASGSRQRWVTVTVSLSSDGEVEQAQEDGPDTPRQRLETVARATVRLVQRHIERHALALEGVQTVEAFGRSWVLVAVQVAGGRQSAMLAGTAEIRESAEHATVFAVLDATNRWLSGRRSA
jgi:hypothetical protein